MAISAASRGRVERIWCLGAEDLDLRIPFLEGLRTCGFRVDAVGSGDPAPFEAAGIPFYPYELTRTLAPCSDGHTLLKLVELARRHRPLILHGFDTKPSLLAPLTVALTHSGRAVRTVNGLGRIFGSGSRIATPDRLAYCGLQKLVSPFTAATVFQNSHDRQYFERHGLVRHGEVTLIPGSGVDIEMIDRALADRHAVHALRQELELDDRLVVTCVSRLTRQKGIPVLLEAAARIAQYRKDVVFLVVGSNEGEGKRGVPFADIERHAPYVRALGARRDVPVILAASDIFVLPTQYGEGVPRSLLEAGAGGLALVTTRVPGCSDVVRDEWNGLLVEPGDVIGLVAQIDRLLDAPDLRRQMATRSRETVREVLAAEDHQRIRRIVPATARRRMMRGAFLPFAPPTIGAEEIAEVVDTLNSGWLSTGPKTHRFEQLFAETCHAPAALALNSGTAGLHLALKVLGVGPGDEVVTTTLTFAASVNVIEHVGARPVFVDVDLVTLNFDSGLLESAITPRTKAIIAVHYAGHPVDLDPILSIADRYGLALIEDAAHAIPAAYKGRPIGSGDNFASFSFYATKNLTTGEGGMLTAHPEYVEKARLLSLHGMSRDAWRRYAKGGSWRYEILLPGFKYNMSDVQASLGLRQLDKLGQMHKRRKAIAAKYSKAFSEHQPLQVPAQLPNVDHAWHLYVLRLRLEMLRVDRDTFLNLLAERNIGCSVHFVPMHMQPYYREKYAWQPDDFPVAYSNFGRMLSLPLHPRLGDLDVEDVIEAVTTLVRTNLR